MGFLAKTFPGTDSSRGAIPVGPPAPDVPGRRWCLVSKRSAVLEHVFDAGSGFGGPA